MSKVTRWIAGVIGVLIALPIIFAVIFFIAFDPEAVKTQITKQLSVAINREVRVDGKVGVSLQNGLGVKLEKVHVGNPQSFKETDFVDIGTLSLSLNWMALMQHKVDITRFHLENANIQLITNVQGENNWEIKFPMPQQTEASKEAKANAPAASSGFRVDKVDFGPVEVVNSVIQQVNAKTGKSQKIEITKATIRAPLDEALKADFDGRYNGAPLTLTLFAERGWQDFTARRPTPIDLKATLNGMDYTVKGLFAQENNSYELNNMEAHALGMDVSGTVAARLDGAVPFISGHVTIPELNVPAFSSSATPTKAAAVRPLVVAEDTPVKATPIAATSVAPDLSLLKAANADVDVTIGKLVLGEGREMTKVKTKLTLNGGRLSMNPLSAELLGVAYQGLLEINAVPAVPTTRVAIKGKDIDFEALAKAFGSTSPLKGRGDVDLDLTGQGFSEDSFKRSLNGKLEVTAGKGGVDLGSGGAAAINLVRMLYPKTTATTQQNLNCAAARFTAQNGVLHTNGLLFDSPIAAVLGEGTVDLAQDNANLLFRYAVKDESAGSILNVPMRATGSLAHLNFTPDEKGVAQKAISILTGGGQVSTGVPKVDMNVKGTNPCIAALNNPQPIMIQQAKPQEVLKDVGGKAKDLIGKGKDVLKGGAKPADMMNNLKGLFGR
jgi:uncharacterized protein involved in outer membrane biogenesis